MFDKYLYYIVSLIISLLLKKSMSVGCVLAFIHDFIITWTSMYVNVGWNSWDNNMAGYGLKDWSLIPGWGMEFVLCQAGYRAHPTSCPLGPRIWSWPLSCGAEMKLYCLSFIYLWGMVLNQGTTFSLHLPYVYIYIILLALKLKFETVSGFYFSVDLLKTKDLVAALRIC